MQDLPMPSPCYVSKKFKLTGQVNRGPVIKKAQQTMRSATDVGRSNRL